MHRIAPKARFDGRISGRGDLSVAGIFRGEASLDGAFTLENGAMCRADVNATRVVIEGAHFGEVSASEHIELRATARVVGRLIAPAVRIVDGARFRGEVLSDGEGGGDEAPSASARSTPPRPSRLPASGARAQAESSSTGVNASASESDDDEAEADTTPDVQTSEEVNSDRAIESTDADPSDDVASFEDSDESDDADESDETDSDSEQTTRPLDPPDDHDEADELDEGDEKDV